MFKSGVSSNETLDFIKMLEDDKTTDLMRAIYEFSSAEKLEALLNMIHNASTEECSAKNSYGFTPLHFAVYKGNLLVVVNLIQKNVPINALDDFNWTPLHYAAFISGESDASVFIAQTLLDAGANPNTLSSVGETPLHRAISEQGLGVVRLLLQHGAIYTAELNSQRPLQLAAKNSDSNILKIVMEYDKELNYQDEKGFTAFHLATICENVNNMKILAEAGADVNLPDNADYPPLFTAVKKNDLLMMQIIKSFGGNLNLAAKTNLRALCLAIDNECVDAFDFLIRNNVDVKYADKERHTPLHRAVLTDNMHFMNTLVEKQKSLVNMVDSTGRTPLHYAAHYAKADVIKFLIDNHARLDIKDFEQAIPLHGAIISGCLKSTEIILQHTKTSLIDEKNRLGETPLLIAAHNKHLEIVRLLLNSGANPDAQTHDGQTPLTRACIRNAQAIVELFLKHGVNVNLPDYERNSPLFYAVKNNNLEIMTALIHAKVNIDTNALSLAKISKKDAALKLLVDEQEKREALDKKSKNNESKREKILTQDEIAKQLEAEAKKKEEHAKWLADEKSKKEEQDKIKAEESLKRQEEARLLEVAIKQASNEVYDYFAACPETQKIFTRRDRAKTIESMIRTQKDADKKSLAKAMILSFGIEKSSKLFTGLMEKFTSGLPAEPAPVPPLPEAPPLPNTVIIHEDNAERMRMNRELHRIEKLNEAAIIARRKEIASSSSSSSSSAPKIGMRTQEEAIRVRGLVGALAALAERYHPSQNSAQYSLYKMKHDLIKISALISLISDAGAKALFHVIFKNMTEVSILRNGTLHLLEINSRHQSHTPQEISEFTLEFYRTILARLSVLSNLNNDLEIGLNSVLKNIEKMDCFPISLKETLSTMRNSALADEIYQKFEASHEAYKAEPDCCRRTDVHHEIWLRRQTITDNPNLSHEERVMLIVEIAELYKQGSNAGIKFDHYPSRLIDAKNNFTHGAVDISEEQINAYLHYLEKNQEIYKLYYKGGYYAKSYNRSESFAVS